MGTFYGRENVTPEIVKLYEDFSKAWTIETCAPRLREGWSEDNKTHGQCSITSFIVQDLMGGKVYGVVRPDGSVHCYNEVDGMVFDLTSEQFGNEVLSYENNPEQFREDHFKDEDKYQRYLLLKRNYESVVGKGE